VAKAAPECRAWCLSAATTWVEELDSSPCSEKRWISAADFSAFSASRSLRPHSAKTYENLAPKLGTEIRMSFRCLSGPHLLVVL
jgi:hypothetical protein